jgi:1-acyl-sn-glycerol-3-phosphate acyltransferase
VERAEIQRGLEDARAAQEAVRGGDAVLFFPEGTLRREPGLLPFHMGAFAAAAGASVPLVPAVLRGTRGVLRGDQWFPRRGEVELVVGPPLEPKGSDWPAAVDLRDRARAWMLGACGEPDLEEPGVRRPDAR